MFCCHNKIDGAEKSVCGFRVCVHLFLAHLYYLFSSCNTTSPVVLYNNCCFLTSWWTYGLNLTCVNSPHSWWWWWCNGVGKVSHHFESSFMATTSSSCTIMALSCVKMNHGKQSVVIITIMSSLDFSSFLNHRFWIKEEVCCVNVQHLVECMLQRRLTWEQREELSRSVSVPAVSVIVCKTRGFWFNYRQTTAGHTDFMEFCCPGFN